MAGWAVARNGLRPVRRLTSDAEQIARTEHLAPLRVEGDDEVARLASAFNQMLTSLAASRDRQRRLVADAGHELRTPLTSLRTNIDLLTQAGELAARRRPGRAAQRRPRPARGADHPGRRPGRAGPRRAHTGRDRHRRAARGARPGGRPGPPPRAVAVFEVDAEPWYVEGDSPAIERALTNLLDNAAKWSPPSGTVTVALHGGVVTVDDEGTGIDDADLPHVFERFYRSDVSRAMPGSGLGLSIVAQVAERHAGTVDAGRSPSGGTRMTFRLPGAATPKPAEPPATAPHPEKTNA